MCVKNHNDQEGTLDDEGFGAIEGDGPPEESQDRLQLLGRDHSVACIHIIVWDISEDTTRLGEHTR